MKQVATLITLLLLSSFLPSHFAASGPDTKSKINCPDKCQQRCKEAGRHKLCIRYCNICCDKCNCVPPGTSGNKDECPCYRDMKNSKGTGKCP